MVSDLSFYGDLLSQERFSLVRVERVIYPGAPLTYFNDGEVRVIFWVYERRRDFLGYAKKSSDFFG